MDILYYLKKAVHRLFRCVSLKPGIYGKIGKHNRFCRPVFIHELTTIGNYNYFGPYTHALNATVGNYCSISTCVKLGLANHDLNCVSTNTKIAGGKHGVTEFNELIEPTVIGNDVWIGANAIVLQGVHIGNGAVIGAGAVVVKDVEPYSIVAGVPAKEIRKRFSSDSIKLLMESDWWLLPEKEAVKKCKELQKKITLQ